MLMVVVVLGVFLASEPGFQAGDTPIPSLQEFVMELMKRNGEDK